MVNNSACLLLHVSSLHVLCLYTVMLSTMISFKRIIQSMSKASSDKCVQDFAYQQAKNLKEAQLYQDLTSKPYTLKQRPSLLYIFSSSFRQTYLTAVKKYVVNKGNHIRLTHSKSLPKQGEMLYVFCALLTQKLLGSSLCLTQL